MIGRGEGLPELPRLAFAWPYPVNGTVYARYIDNRVDSIRNS